MFNPQRAAQYLGRFARVLLPLFGVLLALALFTELYNRDIGWREALASWRFWVAIARDMAPGVVAVLAVLLLATRFVQRLYGLDSFGEARALVNRCLFGLWSFRPWLRTSGGVPEGDHNHILLRVGGPGHLVVYNDTAVVLERGGQFTRVEYKGFPRVHALERVYQLIDLRLLRHVHTVHAMSKEGIPIACDVDISLQIENEDKVPTEDTPYPASEVQVFKAATAMWIQKAEQPPWERALNWSDRFIIHEIDSRLRTILARHPLDRLIGLGSPDSEDPREEIREELQHGVGNLASGIGARIQGVELGDIRVQHEVTQQWIDAWKAEWQRWSVERRSLGKARQAEQIERAKTRAQVMMLTTIADAFQPLVQERQAITSRLILARLFMVLSQAPPDPLTRIYLPTEALSTLKTLRDLIGGNEET
jgi:hypothetical protein